MRIIPKKTKIKNTIWKNYSILDLLKAIIVLGIALVLLFKGYFIISITITIIFIILFIPTPDGLFYSFILDNVKFLFSKKNYINEEIDKLYDIKDVSKQGIVFYYNNTVSKVIKLGQKNFGIEDINEQDSDINYFASALNQLELNQEIDIVKIDRPVNFDEFSTELFNRIIDNKNQKKKNSDRIKGVILKERIDYVDRLNNVFKQYSSDYYVVVYSTKENEIENISEHITGEIRKCGIDAKILDQKEVLLFLKYNNHHAFDEREINRVKEEDYLKWIKPKKIRFSSNKYYIDDIEVTSIMISDYPLKVKNAWGNNIFNIPNTKVVMKIKPIEKTKALKQIDACISELETKEILSDKMSDTKNVNIHKETMIELLNSLQSENENLFNVTIGITAYNYLKEHQYLRKVKRVLNREFFKINSMYSIQKKAFQSSNINTYNYQKYERSINSMSIGAVFPFVRSYIMDDKGILLGKNKNNDYPFIFNVWKRSNLYHNSNAMVIGKSGSGKSFFIKSLIVNEWSNDTRIIICDPEAEYINLTKNLCGNIIDVGNAVEGRINPFHVYQILTDDGKPASSAITFNTHLKILESFFKIVLSDASSVTLEIINNLVMDVYFKKGITVNSRFDKLKPHDFPIFNDLLEVVEEKMINSEYNEEDLKLVKLYLQKFVSGRYSDIWNHPSTLEAEASIINFNFQSLFVNRNNVIANAQMLLIFRFIEQEIINSKDTKENLKTIIICDEAHLFIDSKYPIALDFFYQMNKRIRKYHGSFIPVTQNISDWNGNEELKHKTSTILKNSQYLFIFKLSSPDMQDVVDIYKNGRGFNEEEQRIITTLGTGECFFIGSSEKRAILKINTGENIKKIFEERKE